jgi:hypothetical protein
MSADTCSSIADLTCNGVVDGEDLMLLAEKWLVAETPLRQDLNRNGMVDMHDFAIFESEWRASGSE